MYSVVTEKIKDSKLWLLMPSVLTSYVGCQCGLYGAGLLDGKFYQCNLGCTLIGSEFC